MFKVMNKLEKLKVTEKKGSIKGEGEVKKEESPEQLNNPQNLSSENQKQENNNNNKKMHNRQNDEAQIEETNFDKNKSVEEIYSIYQLGNSNVNTIFMLGNFINALPKNLPQEVRKSTVMNIINASDTNVNILMSDGERRLKALNEFACDYNNAVTDIIRRYKEEIKKLREMIAYYENEIAAKQKMLEEQNNIIKYETHKINDIMNFFNEE